MTVQLPIEIWAIILKIKHQQAWKERLARLHKKIAPCYHQRKPDRWWVSEDQVYMDVYVKGFYIPCKIYEISPDFQPPQNGWCCGFRRDDRTWTKNQKRAYRQRILRAHYKGMNKALNYHRKPFLYCP